MTQGIGTQFAAGKYLGRRVYVEVITDGRGYSATTIEYQITRWLDPLVDLDDRPRKRQRPSLAGLLRGAGMSQGHRIRNIVGGSAGNLVEWYDWYAYTVLAVYFAPPSFQRAIRPRS